MSQLESQLLQPVGVQATIVEVPVSEPKKTLTEVICDSLDNESQLWTFGYEEVRHKNGTRLGYRKTRSGTPIVTFDSEPYIVFSNRDQLEIHTRIDLIRKSIVDKNTREAQDRAMAKFGH